MIAEIFGIDKGFVSLLLFSIPVILILLVTSLVLYEARTKMLRSQLKKARLKISDQNKTLQSILIEQEEERKGISSALHDSLGYRLNIISMNANTLSKEDISVEEANKVRRGILNNINDAMDSFRTMVHNLSPASLQMFGLKAALRDLFKDINTHDQIHIEYSLNYPESHLPPDKEIHIYRIVQELLSNALKHSEASTLRIDLETKPSSLKLSYMDNGRGIDPQVSIYSRGLGLIGIENRVNILKGKLSIHPGYKTGMSVTIFIDTHEN